MKEIGEVNETETSLQLKVHIGAILALSAKMLQGDMIPSYSIDVALESKCSLTAIVQTTVEY